MDDNGGRTGVKYLNSCLMDCHETFMVPRGLIVITLVTLHVAPFLSASAVNKDGEQHISIVVVQLKPPPYLNAASPSCRCMCQIKFILSFG